MGFHQGAYATVWGVTDKGKYSEVQLSISKKNKNTNQYETDFSSNFVRFIGAAHEQASTLQERDRIKILNCDVANSYNKETKKGYTNFCVFSFEMADGAQRKPQEAVAESVDEPVDSDDDLPF